MSSTLFCWRLQFPTKTSPLGVKGAGEVVDLPVQQATKVELVINLKTAKAPG